MNKFLSSSLAAASLMVATETAHAESPQPFQVDDIQCLEPAQYPSPRGKINDFAEVIDADTETTLNSKVANHGRKTSNQIAVVTINDFQGQTAREFAICLGELWGVGQKGKDNGAIFLWNPHDRKIHLQVGEGLKSKVDDARAQEIVKDDVVPAFKQDEYREGLIDGLDALIDDLEDDSSGLTRADILVLGVILGVILLFSGMIYGPDMYDQIRALKSQLGLERELKIQSNALVSKIEIKKSSTLTQRLKVKIKRLFSELEMDLQLPDEEIDWIDLYEQYDDINEAVKQMKARVDQDQQILLQAPETVNDNNLTAYLDAYYDAPKVLQSHNHDAPAPTHYAQVETAPTVSYNNDSFSGGSMSGGAGGGADY